VPTHTHAVPTDMRATGSCMRTQKVGPHPRAAGSIQGGLEPLQVSSAGGQTPLGTRPCGYGGSDVRLASSRLTGTRRNGTPSRRKCSC